MYAYELLARCKHMQLVGQDENKELVWTGTYQGLTKMLQETEFRRIWR